MSESQFRFSHLPAELQREIFLTAATAQPGSVPQLSLVARWICLWVQPKLYEMVTLGANDTTLFLRTMDSKPSDFFTAHVKKLCLSVSVRAENATRILSICTRIICLALWVDYLSSPIHAAVFTSLITPLPLKRLSIELNHLNRLIDASAAGNHAWHTELTHLDIIFWTHEESPRIPGLGILSSITNLALWLRHSRIDDPLCVKVLLIITDEDEQVGTHDQVVFNDPRVVLMPYPDVVRDWEASVRGLPSTWSEAEEIAEGQIQAAAHGWFFA
ncbi:hypothetical protein BD779DRAFT_1526836 [Infundibulicybe gibba]|nr:hypothetical protein BD779DRAFT_1526836 [Infundibulicybe gibba]